jgi:aminodeoxyfutalosine synthase
MRSIDPVTFPLELRGLADKVRSGGRLDEADALQCFSTPHVLHLGRLADHVRRSRHGNVAYYNLNRHINPTNICVYTYNCKFCGFAALADEPHAWQMTHEEVYEHAAAQGGNAVTEFHIVGGLHPDLDMAWYEEMLRGLKERFPDAHLKAFTAIEIGWFARRERISIEEVLVRLREAGLGSLPGGGAEIFHQEVRQIICDGKLDADEWIEVHRTAHGLGIRSNCTMLYGHVERAEHKVDHLMRLRALQDETGGFNAFVPLAYHPENNYMGLKYHTTGIEDLRHLATSRLVLDNVPHLKAYWVMVTPKLAQVALSFGADDVDGTVVEETIYHMAGAQTEQSLSRHELARIVRDAGFEPVERDTLYRPIGRPSATTPELAEAPA